MSRNSEPDPTMTPGNGGTADEHRPTAPVPQDARTPDRGSRSGLSAAIWTALIVGALILVLLLIFILQNNVPARFQYFTWSFELPLGVAMLLAALAGILIAGIAGSVRIALLSHRLKKSTRALTGATSAHQR
jgi:uncharacterized integral membrane protein